MILFFETYSILQVIALYNKVRKADTIYFHSGSIPFTYRFKGYTKSDRCKNIVLKLIRLLNKKVEIQNVSQKKTNEYSWISNKESVDLIDTITSCIENSPSYKIIRSIIDDSNVVKYYQHYLAQGYIANKISFVRMAKDFALSNENSILIVPRENDYTENVCEYIKGPLSVPIPFSVHIVNRLCSFSRRIKLNFILMFFPLLFIIREIILKGANLKKIHKLKSDVLVNVNWGFSKKGITSEGVPFVKDDYLYNKSIGLEKFAYIFNRINYRGDARDDSKNILSKKGIPHIDIQDIKITPCIIFLCLFVQVKLFFNLYRLLILPFKKSGFLIYISCCAIHCYLRKLQELEYIETKVEFCRDDANASHIIRTIVSNKKGIKTVGMQHGSTAGPYVFSQLCYVHYDRYCIHGAANLALYSPHWKNIKISKTGSMAIDRVVNLTKDIQRLEITKDKMTSLYGNRRNTILITFPTPMPYSLIEKWDEMYNALREFKNLHLDANIFLRFRFPVHLQNPNVKRFAELPKSDDRIIIDHTNFTTHELMALSDIYISSSHSTGVIEATVMGEKVFTFDYMGTVKYCYSKYGKEIVLSTKEDVLNLLNNLDNNSYKYDCDWELLKKEYNYHNDGRCLERVQRAVKATLEETIKNNG